MAKKVIKENIVKTLQENLSEIGQVPSAVKPSAKNTVVVFDKSTNPYKVTFSERGFDINGTRLSFEFIETALSKEVSITLDKGKGLVLDSIKMEKILKYKDLYPKGQNVS